jgi:hypothetical protein
VRHAIVARGSQVRSRARGAGTRRARVDARRDLDLDSRTSVSFLNPTMKLAIALSLVASAHAAGAPPRPAVRVGPQCDSWYDA